MAASSITGRRVIDCFAQACTEAKDDWLVTFRYDSGLPECFILSRELLTDLFKSPNLSEFLPNDVVDPGSGSQ